MYPFLLIQHKLDTWKHRVFIIHADENNEYVYFVEIFITFYSATGKFNTPSIYL